MNCIPLLDRCQEVRRERERLRVTCNKGPGWTQTGDVRFMVSASTPRPVVPVTVLVRCTPTAQPSEVK